MTYLLAALAALMGAAGVATAAAAAHATANPLLATMSQMLMIHAAAALAILALGRGGPNEVWYAAAAAAMIGGVGLFSGDLAARVWLGGRLFPFAAPLGGGLTIASWVAAAAVSIVAIFRA
ncbi:MAG: DUF423 domain-containing protein [Rhodoblastus sp.]|nr:DUF423 domain-containing protein [Rhodoblastus sp.]